MSSLSPRAMSDSQLLPAARHSIPSPDSSLVATLQRARLLIRTATSQELVQSWTVHQDFVTKYIAIDWYRDDRILLHNGHTVHVFDLRDPNWKSSIENAASNVGRIASAAFGRTADEVLVASEFGAKLTIWSLITRRGAEIRDPKARPKSFALRPVTGHLAVLTRPAAQDVLMLVSPGSHDIVRSVELGTIDAQELQWSADGSWLAVRDLPSAGHRVQIYTADGYLFRTFSGLDDAAEIDLGVRCMTWSSAGLLILGDHNGRVILLSKATFTPLMTLKHNVPIEMPTIDVWQEQINADSQRTYTSIKTAASPPNSTVFTKTKTPQQGIAMVVLSPDGKLLATREDSVPSTVWIWSMRTGKLVNVLIHHGPVKYLEWHATTHDLLLIHCAVQEPILHLWKSSWIMPLILTMPLQTTKGKLEAHWLYSDDPECFNILFSSQSQTMNTRISLAGDIIPDQEIKSSEKKLKFSSGPEPEDMFDEGNSLDLSPVKYGHTEELGFLGESDSGYTGHGLDDTFHYRKQAKVGG